MRNQELEAANKAKQAPKPAEVEAPPLAAAAVEGGAAEESEALVGKDAVAAVQKRGSKA